MGSEVRVLREKRRCAGVLPIPSHGVFRKSSRDKCGLRLASSVLFKIFFAVLTLLSAFSFD